MTRLRGKYLLAAFVIIAALLIVFLRKNESTVFTKKTSTALTKEAEAPYEIELEQNAELLRASKASK